MAISSQALLAAVQRADALGDAVQAAGRDDRVASKVEALRGYDVLGMQNVVAICYWGRSGSFLLASYLDWHENVVMMPLWHGEWILKFFEEHRDLSLRDKLIAYPAYQEFRSQMFFSGDFPVVEAEYYAAVAALLEVYADQPPDLLASRRTFFQFVHMAYSLALGRRAADPRPLIVLSQHKWDEVAATQLVEDFPEARFVHTVRDPIASFDSWFEARHEYECGLARQRATTYFAPAGFVFDEMLNGDRPHPGMAARSCAVRFEDMHMSAETLMRRFADWVGLNYRPSLLDSTFNGTPYVVKRDGKAWTGVRPQQVQRHWRNMHLTDRLVLYALLHEDFVAWGYDYPKAFANPLVRVLTWFGLCLIPMRMELISARSVVRLLMLPCLRRGEVAEGLLHFTRVFTNRIDIVRRGTGELRQRLAGKKTVAQLL